MSIGTASGEPMATGTDFEQEWASARRGDFEGPASQPAAGGGAPEPANPESPGETLTPPSAPTPASPPVAAQGSPEPVQPPQNQPPPQPAQYELPPQYQQRLREVGAANLDEALTYARQFQSLKGQLPNLEQRWRQQYVAPVEQELNALREERRQALERLVTHDPNTGQARTPEQQAYIRQQIEAAQALENQQRTQAQERQQEQAELAQARQLLAQQQQQTQVEGVNALRVTALNLLPQWKQELVTRHGVPLAELDAYTKQFGYEDRIKSLQTREDMRHVGPLLESLEQYAVMRKGQLQEEQARAAQTNGRYRDVGSSSGAGGQSSADRWAKANQDDFASAWERAKRGELV